MRYREINFESLNSLETGVKIKQKRESHFCNSLIYSGVTGNRTRDTRIFSPLLYQLSYDTIFL